jgi:hypothetical protein
MNDEQEYSGFKTLGTNIDEAYGDDFDMEEDVDDVEFDAMDDFDE